MRKLLSLFCVLALGLVAVACGSSSSDGSSGSKDTTTTTSAGAKTTTTKAGTTDTADKDVSALTEKDYADAFVVGLTTGNKDKGDLVLPKSDAQCVGPKFVSAITVDILKAKGVTLAAVKDPTFSESDLGLSAQQGQAMVDSFASCGVDIFALFAEAITGGLTADQQSCAREQMDKSLANALLVKSFTSTNSQKEFTAVTDDLTAKCKLPAN